MNSAVVSVIVRGEQSDLRRDRGHVGRPAHPDVAPPPRARNRGEIGGPVLDGDADPLPSTGPAAGPSLSRDAAAPALGDAAGRGRSARRGAASPVGTEARPVGPRASSGSAGPPGCSPYRPGPAGRSSAPSR